MALKFIFYQLGVCLAGTNIGLHFRVC